ncbi:MAG: STAS domain-containing protein [Bacteroidetes bacterium]|nr:STAS domain-containing protein [Bacteroidota bacterium]MCL5739185.1 STAS domain-containing protein [Bacteroidota bacterium]
MKLRQKELNGGIVLFEIEGNIVGGPDAMSLNDEVHKLVNKGMRKFVIDVKSVEHINSSGLGILIASLNAVRQAGGNLRIANASAKVIELLKITKLNQIFESYSSVDEAVKSLA